MGEINKLSVAEKIILAEKIWESLPQNTTEELTTISKKDKETLDRRRLEALEDGKAKTIKWSDLKKKLKVKPSRIKHGTL
jgi:putative addiction module component (TIGR02574 family)